MKIFKIAYYLLIYFVLSTSSYAANHYVRAGAEGAKNGSDWTNAWTTLPSTLTRGDTYYIADGTYGGYVFDDAPSGSTYIYIKKATINCNGTCTPTQAHGTDTGWSDSYGDGQAVFTGQWLIRSDYLDIDGVVGGGPGNWEGPFGFKIITTSGYGTGWAPRNIFFDASLSGGPGYGSYTNFRHIEGVKANIPTDYYPNPPCTGTGSCDGWDDPIVAMGPSPAPSNVTFSYCWLHYSVNAILGGSFNNWTIEYSKLGDNYGNSPQHSEIVAIYGGINTTLRYNYFYNWRSTGGIYCLGTSDVAVDSWKIYGNIFEGNLNNAWFGIACGNEISRPYATNWKIYNNTFTNLRSGTFLAAFRTGSGNELKNNIFWYTAGAGPRKVEMQAPDASGNPYYPKSVTNDYNWYTGDTYYNSYGETNGINGGSANPFVDSSSDLHLTSAIPGLTLGTIYNKTMDNVTRGIDGVFDRGAFEYNSLKSSLPSLAPLPPENLRINQ